MPSDFSRKTILGISINDFSGIYRAIAVKANINGGYKLEGEEISIFNQIKKTINKEKNIFLYEGQYYDEEGKVYAEDPVYIEKQDATTYKMPWTPPVEDFLKVQEAKEKNDMALAAVDEYIRAEELKEKKAKEMHKAAVTKIANSWVKTFNSTIKNPKEFRQFIERLYFAAERLNITKTNDGTTKETFQPSEKYPTIEDKIVDEMCGAFAQESKFDTTSTSEDGKFHGIFQFSQMGLNDVKQKINDKLIDISDLNLKPINNMSDFKRLTRLEQLDYMIAFVLDCKKFYSNIGDAEIAPKNMYSMWHLPSQAMNASNNWEKAKKINMRMEERDQANGF